jgi:hypothetical protein
VSRSQYVWVVVGDASRLPVATFTTKHELVQWLKTRRGNTMLRLFRFSGYMGRVEIDIQHLLDFPTLPAKELES